MRPPLPKISSTFYIFPEFDVYFTDFLLTARRLSCKHCISSEILSTKTQFFDKDSFKTIVANNTFSFSELGSVFLI